MRLAILASGSKGNAALIEHGSDLVLLDCGTSLTELKRRMEQLGVALADLTAVLITHEHGDHVRSLNGIVRSCGLKPHMSRGTAAKLAISEDDFSPVVADNGTTLAGGLAFTPYTVPHDAREAVQYCFFGGQAKIGFATDIGAANDYLVKTLSDCNMLVLECNYDPDMLEGNPNYPYVVKNRIRGGKGHLSNEQAAELLEAVSHPQLHTVVAAHLSENNNVPEKALRALGRTLAAKQSGAQLVCAAQHAAGSWIEVAPAAEQQAMAGG